MKLAPIEFSNSVSQAAEITPIALSVAAPCMLGDTYTVN